MESKVGTSSAILVRGEEKNYTEMQTILCQKGL